VFGAVERDVACAVLCTVERDRAVGELRAAESDITSGVRRGSTDVEVT
jgi:hypothetical protein